MGVKTYGTSLMLIKGSSTTKPDKFHKATPAQKKTKLANYLTANPFRSPQRCNPNTDDAPLTQKLQTRLHIQVIS